MEYPIANIHGILTCGNGYVAQLDEPVHLSVYNPDWLVHFVGEVQRISLGLPSDLPMEHIGSTAVPGMLAKPIIDIMVGMEAHHNVESVRAAMVELGYEDVGKAGVPGRIYFRRRDGGAFNIALVERRGSLWTTNIALRDYLRNSPEARAEYAKIKCEALESGIRSLLAYSDYKRVIMSQLISEALSLQPEGYVAKFTEDEK